MIKHRDPIILTVALVLLAFTAGYLAFTFPSVETITGVPSTIEAGKTPSKLQDDELQASIAPWGSPAQWKAKSPEGLYRLFISREYLFYPSLYPDGNYIQPNDGTARSTGGVLLSWYQKYGIDIMDDDVDYRDPDGDGFSNIVEFKNGEKDASKCDGSKSTNPIDPDSHPSYLSRLRLQKYEGKDFHIQFLGTTELGGETLFELRFTDLESWQQPRLKKKGDQLGAEGWVVGDYIKKIDHVPNPNTHSVMVVDNSTLELDNPDLGQKIVLPIHGLVNSPESTADFVMLMPTERDKVIKVAKGGTFTVPFLPDNQYKVYLVDETGASATIHDTKTNQEYVIPKLDPAEWDEVPTEPAAPGTAPATTSGATPAPSDAAPAATPGTAPAPSDATPATTPTPSDTTPATPPKTP